MPLSKELSISEKKKVSKEQIYTETEFFALKGAENRTERILAALLDNREDLLSDRDFRYLELLKNAFRIMTKELSPIIRDKKIRKLLGVKDARRIRQIKNDVAAIFCDTEERNLELERKVMEHKIARIIAKIEKKDIYSKVLPEYYKLMDKIKGTSTHDKNQINWEDWKLPIPEYSSDINDLNPTYDTTFEEIQEEE